MSKRIDKEIWREFIEKFSSYEGTVTQYCIENNLSKSQFYYHKRRFETPEDVSFHAILLKEESLNIINENNTINNIKIEIGAKSRYYYILVKKELLNRNYIQADETILKVINDNGKDSKSKNICGYI